MVEEHKQIVERVNQIEVNVEAFVVKNRFKREEDYDADELEEVDVRGGQYMRKHENAMDDNDELNLARFLRINNARHSQIPHTNDLKDLTLNLYQNEATNIEREAFETASLTESADTQTFGDFGSKF